MVVSAGCRTGRCEAVGADRRGPSGRVSTAVPGSRGHPIRSCLVYAERGNPGGVPAGSMPGESTARKAEIPNG